MKVAILCGGRGLRMNELTEDMPKPMANVCGRPMLWHIMKNYKHFGFDDFVLLLGYKGEKIKEYFMDYEWRNHNFKLDTVKETLEFFEPVEDWKITFLDTGSETMTGSRIRRAKDVLGNETFMLTYGDGLSDVDINKLLEYHRSMGKIATVTGVKKKTQYGILTIQDGLAKSFSEKEDLGAVINGGFFVFEPEIFDYIDDNGKCCALEEAPLKNLAKDGELAVYLHEGFWTACDTYSDIININQLCNNGDSLWRAW